MAVTYNPTDTTVSIIKETTAGVVPATPVFLPLAYIPGTMPAYQSDALESNERTQQRGSAGMRSTNFRVGGGTKVQFKRDAAVELLLQSALSGTWTDDVLEAGNTETNLTIETKLTDGTTPLYSRFSGIQVAEFSLDIDFSGNAEADFTFIGMSRTTGTTAISGATYADLGTNIKLTGLEVKNLTIAGLSAIEGTKLNLKVTNDREAQGVFGTASARGVGTSKRTVTGSFSIYRADFSPETVLVPSGVNPAVAVSFDVGEGDNGYTITIPAAQFAIPEDAEDNSKQLVTLNYTGSTIGTDYDIKIERLSSGD